MAPVQSRLVLAFAVPTVLVFTLYWLKRRQLRIPRPPTDPGGESKDDADLGTLLLNKQVCQANGDCKTYFEVEQEEIKLDLCSIEKVTLSVQEAPPHALPNDTSLTLEKVEEVKVIEEESKGEVVSETKERDIEVEVESCEIVEEKEVLEIEADSSITKVEEEKCSVNITETIEEPTSTSLEVTEKGLDKEPLLLNSVSETQPESAKPVEPVVVKEEVEEPLVLKQTQDPVLQEVLSDLSETENNCDSQEDTNKSIESEIIPVEECAKEIKMESSQAREDLANKLSNLELGSVKIDKERQKMGIERDSANHSPSEVMLGSPSMSNFSDAHSEGSSDSGKGHSDPATSPSRTPAGGSSLAGDAFPALYEFILPQANVGRLIGRHGSFLQEIRTSTNTNIFIKRHPDTNKLKICAIEGTQPDITKALAKIRQKFPLRRFPQLTLEKVSFVSLNPPPLKPEDFHLHLVEGVNNDVILSSLISAGHFFLQQPSHPSYLSLGSLNRVMNEVYSLAEAPVLESPIKDAVCAAPTMGGWYRAQIVEVDSSGESCTVRFLDYGGYLSVESSSLRQIRGDLLMLPFQAVECYLANVAPKAEEEGWSEDAKLFVHSLTHGRILQAQIYEYAEDSTPLVYLYTTNGSEVVLVNEQLVAEGYGVLTVGGTEE